MEKVKVSNLKVVLIGGSAGSLDVVMQLLPALRPNLSNIAIILIMHRKSASENLLANLLSTRTALPLGEAEEKQSIKGGHVYIAPADYHLLIERDRSFSLDASEKINYSRPSIDVTFESAADVFGSDAIGILLSGANADGVDGLMAIKNKGGTIVVQNPASAEVPYMPEMAVARTRPDSILNKRELAEYINLL